VAGCCECGDEPSGSCAMELVSYRWGGLCIPLLSSWSKAPAETLDTTSVSQLLLKCFV
jgi:hypothetical protein